MSNENEYLELCNELKEQYKELEKKKLVLVKDLTYFKKEFLTIYGIIRFIDDLTIKEPILNSSLIELIENLRSRMSDIFENKILNIDDEPDEDDIETLNIQFNITDIVSN